MTRRLLLAITLAGALCAPAYARNALEGKIGALALLTLAPPICNVNIQRPVDVAVAHITRTYRISVTTLHNRVQKARTKWLHHFLDNPGDVPGYCAYMRSVRVKR